MGVESPKDREARLRAWWNGLSAEQRISEVKAGHVRLNLPPAPEKAKSPNQRKAERRRARGKQ